MKSFLQRFFIVLFLSLAINNTNAQNYTGTWEGVTNDGEFVQLNIIQIGTTLCGYSWDYEMQNKRSYCKANFSGSYRKDKSTGYVTGTSFIENSGTHALMNIKFSLVYEGGTAALQGALQIKGNAFSNGGPPSYFTLKKISKKPTTITAGMRACLPPDIEPTVKSKPSIAAISKKPNSSVAKSKIITKPTVKKPITKTITKPIVKQPTNPIVKQPSKLIEKPIVKKPTITTPPIVKKVDSVKIAKKQDLPVKQPAQKIVDVPKITNGRTNNEQSRITLTEKKINLSLYDNGTIDGDTVSVYFDGKLVINKKKLTGNAISIDLELDESLSLHTLILYADNLGSIPPNTALVIVTTASGKRYELYSSATLEKNAALVFEYKPK